MHNEENNPGNENVGHNRPLQQVDADHPGYEISDVDVRGIVNFLAGLAGSVLVFFFFCWGMGKAINNLWLSQDAKDYGKPTKWTVERGAVPAGKGQDLESNAEIEQKQLQQVVNTFPGPRLEMDDGEQSVADLHAREDLLLEHYSTVDGRPGTIRIPIERAMQLIAQRGLPLAKQPAYAADSVAYAAPPTVKAPLTTGFARTGFEQTVIEAREQKMAYGNAVASAEQPK